MTALALMFLLGAACGHYLPRAYAQATRADQLEALRGTPHSHAWWMRGDE